MNPIRWFMERRRARRARLIADILHGLKSGRHDGAELRRECRARFVPFYIVLSQLIDGGVVQKISRWVALGDGTLVRLPQYMLTAKGREMVGRKR